MASLHAKLGKDYAEFYRAAMMYLGFVSVDTLAPDTRLALVGWGAQRHPGLVGRPLLKAANMGCALSLDHEEA